ncbi:g10827 [Coccomyxa elongata]
MAAEARWRWALARVKRGLMLSNKLDTLRDMTVDSHIEPSSLTKVRDLGGGAFATVELCKYRPPTGGETLVAVKRLRPSIIKNKEELHNFVEETKLLRKLQHRNITRYIGVGGHSEGSLRNAEQAKQVLDSMYLVQEFIDGGNLRKQVLEQMCTNHLRKKYYSEIQALHWAIQIAKGLKYLHTAKPMVIWRDAKLENILMRKVDGGKNLEACLADFGLSAVLPMPGSSSSSQLRQCVRERRSTGSVALDNLSMSLDDILEGHKLEVDSTESTRLPGDGAVFEMTGKTGSYFYMAPEVANGQPYNEKADVFSFGCILYELFVGAITSQLVVGPTGNMQAAELYAAKVAAGYRRPLPNFLPEELRELISECWAQDMRARPSMAQALHQLQHIESLGLLDKKGSKKGKQVIAGAKHAANGVAAALPVGGSAGSTGDANGKKKKCIVM